MTVHRNVQQWFKKSSQNLRLAKLILNLDEKFYEHVCFNAQQSVEKSIKGYLTHKKIRFDKTHDIAILASLVAGVDRDLAENLMAADELTEFAVKIRYPEEAGDQIIVDRDLAQKSIHLAQSVYDQLSNIIGL